MSNVFFRDAAPIPQEHCKKTEKTESTRRLVGSPSAFVDRSYVDQLMVVTLLQVVEDWRIVQVGQVGHILSLLILGRVHLLQCILLEVLGLNYEERKVLISCNQWNDTYVDFSVIIALLQVVKNRGFIQVGEISHVLSFFKFRRVHLRELILPQVFRLHVAWGI